MNEEKEEKDMHIKRCGGCPSFDASRLKGYGYCLEGRTVFERARLLNTNSQCILKVDW